MRTIIICSCELDKHLHRKKISKKNKKSDNPSALDKRFSNNVKSHQSLFTNSSTSLERTIWFY